MATIGELKNWCNQARLLLDRTGKDKRGRMEDRNNAVAKLLTALQQIPTLANEYAQLFKEYEFITARARTAEQNQDKAGVAAASRDLSILKNKLREQLAAAPNADKSAQKAGQKATTKLNTTEKQTWAQEKGTRDHESEAARLEPLADAVLQDPLMTQLVPNSIPQDLVDAGVDVARQAIVVALKTRDTRTQGDVDAARNLLPAVNQALLRAADVTRDRREKDRLAGLANAVATDALMTQARVQANDQEWLAAGVVDARDEVTAALKDRDTRTESDVNTARGLLDAVRQAIQAAEAAARTRLEKERLKNLATAVRDDPLMTKVPKDANPQEILAADLANKRLAVIAALKGDDDRVEQDITDAKLLLPAVQGAIEAAEKAAATRLAKAAYELRLNAVRMAVGKALQLAKKDPPGLPQAALDKFTTTLLAWKKCTEGEDWVGAKKQIEDCASAAQELNDQYLAGQDYFDAYELIKPEFDAALNVYRLKAAKLAVLSGAFDTAYSDMVKATKKPDWPAAKGLVATLKAACIALRDAGAQALGERPQFDIDYKAITDLPAAQTAAKSAPASLSTEVDEFRKCLDAVNKAKIAGDYTVAKDAIPALQNAINALNLAFAGVKAKKLSFEQELNKIAGLAEARTLAAANAASVTAKVPAFNLASGNVDGKTQQQDWAAAELLLPPLASATRELLEAKALFNSGYGEPKQRDLKQKMKLLEPRTNPAGTPGPTTHISALKAEVKKTVDAITQAIAGSDWANAERLHAQLLVELPKLETAVREYEAHLITFNAAKNGEVKSARETELTPSKLATERTRALAATEARIGHFAGKGSVKAKADPMVGTWVDEAKAWKAAQAASDNLNTGSDPDPSVLRTLASLPGGGKVMDALVAGLPEGKPEKFLREAINIRFGVAVKQFDKKPESLDDTSTVTEIGADAPDKSLKKMYEMFAKVPEKNVKGKITELLHFDEDAGGAAAGNKKIYMYCGRPNDPKGSKQKFGEGVVPDGEEIDPDFIVATGKDSKGNDIPDELPYFDFAALHEVGHAVDDAEGIMSRQPPGQIAGWQKHTPASVAAKAAAHFKYNEEYIRLVLTSATSTPPTTVYPPEHGMNQTAWDKARDEVLNWCKSIRVGMAPWNNAALSRHAAIDGVMYQESYAGKWVSYNVAARSKGITPYQFRSPAEWFAELYAAYFSGKLKKDHPYASWLKPLKKLA